MIENGVEGRLERLQNEWRSKEKRKEKSEKVECKESRPWRVDSGYPGIFQKADVCMQERPVGSETRNRIYTTPELSANTPLLVPLCPSPIVPLRTATRRSIST